MRVIQQHRMVLWINMYYLMNTLFFHFKWSFLFYFYTSSMFRLGIWECVTRFLTYIFSWFEPTWAPDNFSHSVSISQWYSIINFENSDSLVSESCWRKNAPMLAGGKCPKCCRQNPPNIKNSYSLGYIKISMVHVQRNYRHELFG